MISALLFNRQTGKLREIDAPHLLQHQPTPEEAEAAQHASVKEHAFQKTSTQCRTGELMWLDISEPSDEDYALLAERFGLHPMVIEDIKANEGRPKLHDYGDYLFIVCHALRSDNAEKFSLHVTEIDILVGADYVVTIHEGALSPLNDLHARWLRSPELMKSGAAYLLYEILDEVLDDYFPLLDEMDERIDEFETRLFQDFEENLSVDIFALKRHLVQIRRVAGPTRDLVNVLLRHDADSGGKHFAYFQDLYDHSARIVDNVDTFRELLAGALDAYLALASNRMNAVMKTLTSASIILLIPTLIAGIYGMNFEWMPELHDHYGYPMALGAMMLIMLALYAMFKRKNWL